MAAKPIDILIDLHKNISGCKPDYIKLNDWRAMQFTNDLGGSYRETPSKDHPGCTELTEYKGILILREGQR